MTLPSVADGHILMISALRNNTSTVSGGDTITTIADNVSSGDVMNGQVNSEMTVTSVAVDIEPLTTELVGVNEKLTLIVVVIVVLICYKLFTMLNKFLDMFF